MRTLSVALALACLTIVVRAQDAGSFLASGKKYDDRYQYDSAVIMYEKARQLFPQGSIGEAQACHALGDIYKYVLYDFDKAEVNYERALTIQQQIDPSDIKNLTRLYYNLATTNRSQSDYETAIIWCMKAIDGCRKMKDNAFLERAYSIAGNIYRDRHVFDSAVNYYQKGVAVNQSINKGKKNETLAGLYGGWGGASFQRGDLDDAAEKLSDAIAIYKQPGTSDKSIYLHTVRVLAAVQIKRNKLDEAGSVLQLAEKIRADLKLQRGGPPSALYKTWGDYLVARGDNISAYGYYQKALQAATTEPLGRDGNPKDIDQVDFKSFAYEALLGKAGLTVGSDAMECYTIAERIMIASRSELDTEEAKWSYIDANYRLYENILRTLYHSDQRDTASLLYFMESSKSKSLADALQEAELKKKVGSGDTLLSKLRTLKQRSISLHHAGEKDQLLENSRQISVLEAAIDAKYPPYLKTTASLSDLKQKLGSLDAIFIEYFWGEEDLYTLVVTPEATRFYRLEAPDVTSFTKTFQVNKNDYSSEAATKFAQRSLALYASLIEPLQLPDHKRLIIVPDGPLMQLPFETLVTTSPPGQPYNRLHYLINDYIISYNFSASRLLATQPVRKGNPSLLAFGSTDELAGSGTELNAISGKFSSGTFFYSDDVTEKNFKDRSPQFDLLHLAVHGTGDTGEEYSATLNFRDKDGPEDGRLYWYELYSMNLRASLAVLSSCESGIGKTYRGEGMLSMANAFTFAGCSNIVMGLWKVDDQVSVKLMDTFYSELLNGMAIDEALALAKRTYLVSADQVSSNPKLWGSLVAYGESPILRADEIPTSWVVIALTVLVAAITILVIKTRKK